MLLGLKTVKQRTEFAISTYRPYVKEALDFRNRFAERPFVCRPLYETTQIIVSSASRIYSTLSHKVCVLKLENKYCFKI